jgi:hypothetical protein
MGSLLPSRLVKWFDTGLSAGQFNLPNDRHIILNEFPRLMKASRLRASAGADEESFYQFLVGLSPNVFTLADCSPAGMRTQLSNERGPLPALRKGFLQVLPYQRQECWFVYTPPLSVMRKSWSNIRSQYGLPADNARVSRDERRADQPSG